MVSYVLEAARYVAGNRLVVVVGHQADKVRQIVGSEFDVKFALQERQLGKTQLPGDVPQQTLFGRIRASVDIGALQLDLQKHLEQGLAPAALMAELR